MLYYRDDHITIYHGDCREIAPTLEGIDAVISDPPYGMNWPCENVRFCGGSEEAKKRRPKNPKVYEKTIFGDNHTFNPDPWINFDKVILWGSNHYAKQLPIGTTLVWVKRFDDAFGSFLSDAEIAWMKNGHGVYCFRDLSMQGETLTRTHPTQKPIPLMKWCIEKAGMPKLILDPFMGSGTTLRAAKDLGLKAIGIEIEERYCEIAAKRMAQEVLFSP